MRTESSSRLLIIGVILMLWRPAASFVSGAEALVRIPFEFRSGYIIFPLTTESQGSVAFLFDTGCQTTVIGPDISPLGPGNRPLHLQLGLHRLQIEKYRISSQKRISKVVGRDVHGVIGNDLLHRFQIKLDFRSEVMTIFGSGPAVSSPEGENLELEVNALVSSLPLGLTFPGGRNGEGRFVIDTGAPVTLVLNSPAAETYDLGDEVRSKDNRTFKTQADTQTAVEIRTDSVRIGRDMFTDVPVYVSTSARGLFSVTRYSGILGTGMLSRFIVVFDYQRSRINLERIDFDS